MTTQGPAVDIVAAMNSPALFQRWFPGESWDGWRAVLRAAYALPMTDAEIEFFRTVAERDPPKSRVREMWIAVGRRGGKDSVASLIAAYSAALFSESDRLRPGERALVMCLAVDRDQAKVILNYTRSYFSDLEPLKDMVVRETADGFALENGVDVAISTSSFRSVRGRPILCAIFDEVAFWRDENSASPDDEVYTAIRPGAASIPGSMIIGISSPYRKSGLLYSKFKKHFGQDGDVLVIRAPTRALNPTIPQEIIDEALADDPIGARAEWLAEFRSDISGYVDLEVIESAVDRGVTVRSPKSGVHYVSACDPSGGVRDSFVCAVSHDEQGVAVLDALLEIRAPFDPAAATERVVGLIKSYGLKATTGDKYAAEWVVSAFGQHKIDYQHSERDRSKIYADCLPLFTSGRARLLDNPRLVNQFASLERKTSSLGRDKIDHGVGGSDDACNAAALAMVLASAGPDWSRPGAAYLAIAREEMAQMKAAGRTISGHPDEPPTKITREWAKGSIEYQKWMAGEIGPPV
jgi:hypothetical protein